MRFSSIARSLALAIAAAASVAPNFGVLGAQQTPPPQRTVTRLVAEPARVNLKVGDSTEFKVTAYDAQGQVIPDAAVRVGGPRMAVFFGDGFVKGLRAGSFRATATAASTTPGVTPVTLEIPVTVTWPVLSAIDVTATGPGRLYAGVTIPHAAKGLHADRSERKGLVATWRSSDPSIARVDRFGNVTAVKPGSVTITAEAEGVRGQKQYTIVANPVTALEIDIPEASVRTGDVVPLKAIAKRANGSPVDDAPITWSYTYTPDDTIAAPGGPGIIDMTPTGWKFAGNYGGRYTIMAKSGNAFAEKVLAVAPRDVRRRITISGRGNISSTHTSDLWPFTGKDGRDYAIVGTWGGDGWAIVFDITDMSNIVKTDSVQVDARTINDVTVSPDARYAVLTREGASNRVNGVVILDLANPAHPKIASTFNEQLTGGVHNAFATNDYLFAISGGAKYVIIDVKDIYKPKYVSEYKHPNARIHDLWVHDGIAYSAQGGVGTVVVDVGNGKYGGSIEKPKLITVFPINSGHEIFTYFKKSTGRT